MISGVCSGTMTSLQTKRSTLTTGTATETEREREREHEACIDEVLLCVLHTVHLGAAGTVTKLVS